MTSAGAHDSHPESTMVPHSRPLLGSAEAQASANVIRSGMLIGGAATAAFRQRLATLAGVGDVQLFSSGREALRASLESLSLPPGAGVVVPTYACEAVAWAIIAAGLRVVPVDIGEHWLVEPDAVEAALDPQCGAVVLAPPFGLLQPAQPFRRFGLPVIHDLCQASPALLARADRESLGDIVVMSFHPTKYICAAGGGVTFDMTGRYATELAAREEQASGPAPFGDMQAAMGLAQLDRLPAFASRRAELHRLYRDAVPGGTFSVLDSAQDVEAGDLSRMPLVVSRGRASDWFAPFRARGIIVRQGVDNLLHRGMGLRHEGFPNAVSAFDRVLSMPFHPSLDDGEARRVADALNALI